MSADVTVDRGLVRRLGALGLGAAVFNTVVGSGIFVIPATLARDVGSAAPFAYLACTVAMGAVSLCFAAAGSRVPASGGPYGYVAAAFGPMAGFMIGLVLWLSNVLAAAGIAAAIADGLAHFIPALGGALPRAAFLLALFAALAAVNGGGVSPGAGLVGVLTVVKLAPLAVLLAVALPHVHPANLAPTAPHPAAFGRAMILALFAFQGMETALAVSGEVKSPARNIPLGLLVAMGTVAVLYIALQVTAQGVLGPALARSQAPLVDTMAAVSPPLGVLLAVGALVSMLGFLASDALASPRLLFAFAEDGVLPRFLATLGRRSHAPVPAIAVHTGLAAILAISGGFTELVILSSLTTVIVYVVACVAAVRLQRRGVAQAGPPLKVRGLEVAAAVGVIAMIGLLANGKPAELLGCAAALAIGAGWYRVARRRTSVEP